MARKRLFGRLFPSYLLIAVITLVAITWYSFRIWQNLYLEKTSTNLLAQARLIENQMKGLISAADAGRVDSLSKVLGKAAGSRITIILPSGKVIGDSDNDPSQMENHADRPEIMEALAGKTGNSVRYSATLHLTTMYLAVPALENSKIVGVVRTAVPLMTISNALEGNETKVVVAGSVIILFVLFMSFIISRRLTRPLEELKSGAERFARGDLNFRLFVPGTEEINSVAKNLNQMAASLNEKVDAITRHANEKEAILSSMIEGVLAVDKDYRILSVNAAAAQMFGVDGPASIGRILQETVRIPEIHKLIANVLRSGEPAEIEIALSQTGGRRLQARGVPLKGIRAEQIGVLIILNDVTSLKRLENMRREFVGNVSHELKTPLTTIQGFVETLLDGALDRKEDAARFLEIIQKQIARLNSLIDDLLTLSRIEKDSERGEVPLTTQKVQDVLTASIESCETKAAAHNVTIHLDCPPEIKAQLNARLMEQAVVNLIDNAIKFTEPGGRVEVSVSVSDKSVEISVRDYGCGIEKEHQARIFERFYRVDKARSREMGGTGLGLAIAKHIVMAHRGLITVVSAPGKGTTFIISLPRS